MHGIQSNTGISKLGYSQTLRYRIIAKMVAAICATAFVSTGSFAAPSNNHDGSRVASAKANATIVRPFRLNVPKQSEGFAEGKIGAVIVDQGTTESIRECSTLLGSDAQVINTNLCTLYLKELH